MGKKLAVKYIGGRGKLVHTGLDKQKMYVFAGDNTVMVEDKADIAFYERKAEQNPETWVAGTKKKVATVEAPTEMEEEKEEK